VPGLVLLLLVVVLAVKGVSASVGGARVFNRERANGVHPRLQELLDAWTREGTWNIVIGGGSGFPNGGLRTQEEVDAANAAGNSRATDVSQTPHGRGAALDVWPEGFSPFLSFADQPDMQDMMQQFGEWAESHGMVWGGRFRGVYGSDPSITGDWPHVELPQWVALPYPPPDYANGATA
jgi:hypothetical protein